MFDNSHNIVHLKPFNRVTGERTKMREGGRVGRQGGTVLLRLHCGAFVRLRLSSSLGKWKLNTSPRRSGYQVREEARMEKQSPSKREEEGGRAEKCGERNRR